MLISVKIQLFAFFCVIFAPFLPLNVVSSTSALKVKRASLPSAIMKLNEKMDDVRSRVDQLESNGNNTFDVQEMMTQITRAISDSNGQIIKQFEEKLEKTIEKIEQNNLKRMEKAWTEAKVRCEEKGMTLAMPKDYHRTIFLWNQLNPIYSAQKYLWFGLKRDAGGSGWFWVDGSGLGEYTGGRTDMKSVTGSKFAYLYFTGVSEMWYWGYASAQWYAVCEANLISH